MPKKIILTMIFLFLPFSVFAYTPNDTNFSRQWYLRQIDAESAWDIEQGSEEVVIAVIDTSVDLSHPDLDGNIWSNIGEIADNGIDDDDNGYIDDVRGWDYIGNDNDPSPDYGGAFTVDGVSHGTAVASIIAAEGNNRNGIAGVSWRSKIMPLRVLDSTGSGYSEYVAKAIYYAIDKEADVINLSFVGFNWSDDMNTAIKRAWEAGIVVVSAAGNTPDYYGGTNLNEYDEYPACVDQYNEDQLVLGVASTDTLDQKSQFSNYGKMCVDISAPGMDMYSARSYNPDKGFDEFYSDEWSGTSFSAPIVSGVAALIKSLNPGLSAQEINYILIASGDDIDAINPDYVGELGLRVNARKALEMSQQLAENGSAIVVGSPRGELPRVYKLGREGELKSDFSAYGNYFLGFDAEAGDVSGNGHEEIVIGAGNGGGPQLRIFDKNGGLVGQFFAYDKNFRGGVYVALGDINGDGVKEIITSPGRGGGPHILVYNDHGEIKGNFMAYDPAYRGGVKVASGDIDDDDSDEIITAFYVGDELNVRIFRRSGALVSEFVRQGARGEIFIDTADIDGQGGEEILFAYQAGGQTIVSAADREGRVIEETSFESGAKLVDVKGFYDYISGRSRMSVISYLNGFYELKYFDSLFELIKDVKIEL